MKKLFFVVLFSGMAALLTPSPVLAQAEPAHRWSHGTTLAGTGGVGTASDATGALLGGTLGWELTPRVGVDGTATWLDKQEGASAFAASLGVHAALAKSLRAAPFVEGGFGLYLASYDPRRATNIPSFYANRLVGTGTNTFTDPAFFAGGGVEIFRTRHLAFRPTVGAIIAMHNSQAYTVTTFTLRAEYHFEEHPVTLSR